jgi:hypothetical protein
LPDAATRVEVVQNGLPQPDPASGGKTVAETFKALRPGGVSIVLGVGPEPIEVSAMDLMFGNRKHEGTLTGTPATGDETLRFSALSGVFGNPYGQEEIRLSDQRVKAWEREPTDCVTSFSLDRPDTMSRGFCCTRPL